jgi:hypothetical protein
MRRLLPTGQSGQLSNFQKFTKILKVYLMILSKLTITYIDAQSPRKQF